MLSSIILGCAIVIALLATNWVLMSDSDNKMKSSDVVSCVSVGILVGVINYFIPKFAPGTNVAFMAPICLVVMVSLYAGLIYLWVRWGTRWREVLPMALMTVLLYFTTVATAVMTAVLVTNHFLATLIVVLPTVLLVVTNGFFVTNMFNFLYRKTEDKKMKLFGVIAAIATAVLAIALVLANVDFGALKFEMPRNEALAAAEVPSETMDAMDDVADAVADDVAVNVADDTAYEVMNEAEVGEATAVWYKFYNLDLQLDADPLNDFNFGPNPFKEGMSAEDFRKEFYKRMYEDPAFAAGALAWLDANVGTRYLGEFYDSCKGDWAKTINLTKEKFMADQAFFYQTVDAAVRFFDTAEAKIEHRTGGLDDQMYQNPFTPNGVPDVIVMTTEDHGGYFLTFLFAIKADQQSEVQQPTASYRVDCGFQPTNVEEVMHITPNDAPRTENPGHSRTNPTPKNDPTPTPAPGGKDDPTPKPSGGGEDDPEPDDPTPELKYKKDKTKGTKGDVVKPNDDPGPGPDTNNGKDAQTSTKDQKENSNHMDQKQYEETIEEKKEINQTQKTGDDPSTPSTTGPANTQVAVNNNADKGNGGEPINAPTEVTAPETVKGDPESVGLIEVPG